MNPLGSCFLIIECVSPGIFIPFAKKYTQTSTQKARGFYRFSCQYFGWTLIASHAIPVALTGKPLCMCAGFLVFLASSGVWRDQGCTTGSVVIHLHLDNTEGAFYREKEIRLKKGTPELLSQSF